MLFRSQNFTLEQRMHDVRAVLDEVGSERAALLGVSEGGPMSLLYAATYPEPISLSSTTSSAIGARHKG